MTAPPRRTLAAPRPRPPSAAQRAHPPLRRRRGRRRTRCAASRSTSRPASSRPSWARRAPASRRSCTCSPGSTARPRAPSRIGGEEISAHGRPALTKLRRRHIGFVFQSFNLLPTLTAEENILPAARDRPAQARPRRRSTRCSRASASAERRDHTPDRALRRPAAARRHRPRAHRAPDRPVRRRADGQPRLGLRRGDPRRCCARRSTSTARPPSWSRTTRAPPPAPTASLFLADGRIVGDMADPTEDGILAAMREAARR